MEGIDYALLPKTAWEKFVLWYWLSPGSGPICRYVTVNPNECNNNA